MLIPLLVLLRLRSVLSEISVNFALRSPQLHKLSVYSIIFRISNAAPVEIKDDNAAESYDASSFENPFDEYVGQWSSEAQWNGSDYYIKITRDREIMNVEVSAHSAVADYLWNYLCICSEDGTYIECKDAGTLLRTDYAPNGDMQEPVTVYSDGGAKFNIKGGTLFWDEFKEGTARQVSFIKIG